MQCSLSGALLGAYLKSCEQFFRKKIALLK